MVEEAEQFMKEAGFRVVRVRHHGDLARIEVPAVDVARAMASPERERIVDRFREIGYRHVTVDLEGYRSGSYD